VSLVFCALATLHDEGGLTIALEWERDAGETQIVTAELWAARHLGRLVPDANAGQALHHPFRYGS
jgi:hypothetical protein